LEVSLKDEIFSNVFILYESFITFLILFFSECFIEAKGLVKFSKSVISRSNSLKIFPMKLYQVQIPSESTDLQVENASLSRGFIGSV
jgi:hypothetical protein